MLGRYLRFGRCRSTAAAALHVISNTVAYRAGKAEELLGTKLSGDVLKMRAALESSI
jgi:DNA-binding PucR family transcriptional regulator